VRRQRRSLRLLALIAGLSLVAAACGGDDDADDASTGQEPDQATEEVPEGGNLTIAAEQEPECMDWMGSCSGSSWGFWSTQVNTIPRVFDVVKDGDEWVYETNSMLASDPELVTDPEQKVTYTIADQAVWSDGEPIICADFVYTWDQMVNGEDIYDRTGWTNIGSVDCPDGDDGKTVVTTYAEPYAGWKQNFAGQFGVMPSHLLEGKDRNAEMTDGYDWSAGPWLIDHWERGVEIELVPNDNFWGDVPKLDSVTFRFITDTSAELQAFKGGEVLGGYPQPQPDLVDELDRGIDGMDYTLSETSPNSEAIWINNAEPPFDDVDVRKALAYSLDRPAIVERLFGPVGVDQPMNSFNASILGEDFGNQQAFADYELDLDRVDELMEGAGYEKDDDGFWAKDGDRPTITFKTTTGNKRRELTEDIIIDQAAEAGFDITKDNQEAGDLFGTQLPQGQFQLALYAQVLTSLEPSNCALFCSQNVPTAENDFSGQNWTRTVVEGLDEPLEQVDSNPNTDERSAAAAEADDLMAENVVSLPVDPLPNIFIFSDQIAGPAGDNPILGPFWNMNLWGVEG